MKVSLNTLRFYQDTYKWAGDLAPDGIDALVEKIGAQLGAVEEVEDMGAKYRDVIVARVASCENHPDADRLHVCKIDDGGVVEHLERDENGFVQVVCGAPNVREDMFVAWLPPGATVPETYHHEAPFVLEARALRGVVSNGMLASPKELALSDEHDGILEIDTDAKPGESFAKLYQLDDHIIDIENKMFTHRPDCFGFMGVARELAGIQGQKFTSPEWYVTQPEFPKANVEELALEVKNEAPELVPRFTAVTMRNVKVEKSPMWMQTALLRLGSRPINNVVDYTNYIMLLTGQPLHAYDYDKVGTGKLGVRLGHDGEKLNLLNGKEATLTKDDVVITNGEKAIGVGGVMGGADTEVDENTKNIIIECANFDMYAIRRTSMRHGLFTDAVTRFNKGQSPLQNLAVLAKIVDEIRQFAGGKVAGAVVDDNHLPDEMRERGSVHASVVTNTEFVNTRLGLQLSTSEIKTLLENVEFVVNVVNEDLTIKAPFWRTDIEIPEDIVEEIGRLYGYDRLPLVLPKRDTTPAKRNVLLDLKSQVRDVLSRSGANEVLTYSFVHGNLLDRAGQSRDMAFQISNALSPDLQYYRLTVLPSLLDKVHGNIRAGYDEFALFEIGKGHSTEHLNDDGLPIEFETLDLVYAANDKLAKPGAAYYQAQGLLTELTDKLKIRVEFKPLGGELVGQGSKPFDPKRSALVYVKDTGIALGIIGELKPSVRKALKLPVHTAAFSLGLVDVLRCIQKSADGYGYEPLSRYPGTAQDVCFRVPDTVSFAALEACIQPVLDAQQVTARLQAIDIYKAEKSTDKQITFRISMTNYDKTMTSDEADQVISAVIKKAQAELGAVVV